MSVPSGDTCCFENATGLPGPKGENGSPGETFGWFVTFECPKRLMFITIVLYVFVTLQFSFLIFYHIGIPGEPGTDGLRGIPGLQGTKGMKGDDGEFGEIGLPGSEPVHILVR